MNIRPTSPSDFSPENSQAEIRSRQVPPPIELRRDISAPSRSHLFVTPSEERRDDRALYRRTHRYRTNRSGNSTTQRTRQAYQRSPLFEPPGYAVANRAQVRTNPPLHNALLRGDHYKISKILKENPHELNTTSLSGDTALQALIKSTQLHCKIQTLDLFMKHGLTTAQLTENLSLVCDKENWLLLNQMMKHGADVSAIQDQFTPELYALALRKDCAFIVKHMIEKNLIPPNIIEHLNFAFKEQAFSVVSYLLSRLKNDNGTYPEQRYLTMELTLEDEHDDSLSMEDDHDMLQIDENQFIAFCSSSDYADLAIYLTQHKAIKMKNDMFTLAGLTYDHQLNRKGLNPLFLATKHGLKDLCYALILSNANIMAYDHAGDLLWHHVARDKSGILKHISPLLQAPIDLCFIPFIINHKTHKTPLKICVDEGNFSTFEVFCEWVITPREQFRQEMIAMLDESNKSAVPNPEGREAIFSFLLQDGQLA